MIQGSLPSNNTNVIIIKDNC